MKVAHVLSSQAQVTCVWLLMDLPAGGLGSRVSPVPRKERCSGCGHPNKLLSIRILERSPAY